MYCSNCGVRLKEDSNFCARCGKEVCKEESVIEDTPAINPTPPFSLSSDSMASDKLEFGKGAMIWLYTCLVINGFVALILFFNFLNRFEFDFERIFYQITHNEKVVFDMLVPIVSSVMCNCFWQIIKNKVRFPFYFIVGISIFSFIYNVYVGVGFFAVLGFANPIITYLVLRKNWPYMPLININERE